jgi:L,D-peptidoglycan transpeptidase YkuD (ErfK/YbiS/YcfS/YnhG family)
MDIHVDPGGLLAWPRATVRCAIGRGGAVRDKREGDGATPVGCFPLRQAMFRPDRVARPRTSLPVQAIAEHDGWCDDPGDARYNRLVRLPYPGRHERLWRDDGVYDLLVVLGYNDDPVRPGLGSAIFLHAAAPDFAPTAGCVAIALVDLVALLEDCDLKSRLCVSPPPPP